MPRFEYWVGVFDGAAECDGETTIVKVRQGSGEPSQLRTAYGPYASLADARRRLRQEITAHVQTVRANAYDQLARRAGEIQDLTPEDEDEDA